MGRIVELNSSGDFKSGQTGVTGKGAAICLDCADQDEAYDLADAFFPAVVGTIPRGSIEVTSKGSDVYEVAVEYASTVRDNNPTSGEAPAGGQQPATGTNPSDPVGRKYSVSTKGGTQHIERSLETITAQGRDFGAGNVFPPDYGKAINFKDGAAQGTEIVTPNPEFSISEESDKFEIGYFVNACFQTGTVNDDDWRGFPSGSLLFLGLDASNRDGVSRKWDLTWHFRYSPPVPNIVEPDGIEVADGLVVAEKEGWDYLWIAYEKVVDAPANKLAARPYAAYVERVYRRTDFDDLGIGE